MIPSDVSAPAARGGLAPEPAARSFYTAITERSQHRHMVGELRRHMPVAYDDAGGVLLHPVSTFVPYLPDGCCCKIYI